jgi:hypothetical protein
VPFTPFLAICKCAGTFANLRNPLGFSPILFWYRTGSRRNHPSCKGFTPLWLQPQSKPLVCKAPLLLTTFMRSPWWMFTPVVNVLEPTQA